MRTLPFTSTSRQALRTPLVVLAATGVVVAAAAVTLPAAGAPVAAGKVATTTTSFPYPTCGAGPEGSAGGVRPLCTRPPTTSTSPSGTVRSTFDFEDGTTQGWSVLGPKVKLAVRKQAAHSGRLGLVVNGINATLAKRPAAGPTLLVSDGSFTGSGTDRHISLYLSAKVTAPSATTTPTWLPGSCRPTPVSYPTAQVRVQSGGQELSTAAVTFIGGWIHVDLSFPSTGAAVTVDVRMLSGKVGQLWIDDVTLYRAAPYVSSTITRTMTTTHGPSLAAAPGVVRPMCTRTSG